MAFFSIVPEDYRRGGTPTQRQSKRAIMHVDQVVIQADRVLPSNRNTPEAGRIRYHEPVGSIYSNDTCLGPPERKKMRRDYSIVSAQPSEDYGSERSRRYHHAHPCDRRDTHSRRYSRRYYQPASSWESTDSSFSSITQSIADYEFIEEERKYANKSREDGSSRGTYMSRNHKSPKKRSTHVPAQPPYDMSSPCSRCCKPESEPKPVEIQIQECPGLPDMRAYVVVPLKRSAAQNRGELDQAARRAARAVPPMMRASRHPQAIVVECNRNKDASSSMRPASTSNRTSTTTTTATAVPVTPVPAPHSSSASNPQSREASAPASSSASRRQEPVDGLANDAVAAVAAATVPAPPAAPTGMCQGQCTIASYAVHGKVPTTRRAHPQ